MIRVRRKRKEDYLNANDLVRQIRDHEKIVDETEDDVSKCFRDAYKLAHEHIIDIIKLFAEVDVDKT